jgi:hypothetical protein
MSVAADSRVLVEISASDFAFRSGQSLEGLLWERSIEVARQSGSSTVTAEHVESCLDHALFDDLLRAMRESSNDRTADEAGVQDRQSRKAA